MVLRINNPELLHNIGLINVVIHDINDHFNVAAILTYLSDWEDKRLTLGKLDRGTSK